MSLEKPGMKWRWKAWCKGLPSALALGMTLTLALILGLDDKRAKHVDEAAFHSRAGNI